MSLPEGSQPQPKTRYWVAGTGNAQDVPRDAWWSPTSGGYTMPIPQDSIGSLANRYCRIRSCGWGRAFADGLCYSHSGYRKTLTSWEKPADGSWAPYVPCPSPRFGLTTEDYLDTLIAPPKPIEEALAPFTVSWRETSNVFFLLSWLRKHVRGIFFPKKNR